jgi:hypothetical protein
MIAGGSSLCGLVALLTLGGCAGAVPESVEEAAPAPRPEIACSALGEIECLESEACVLRPGSETAYVCEVATDPCEVGFDQRSARAADCAADYRFVPAHCYCAPGLACFCGGGPPARCVSPDKLGG